MACRSQNLILVGFLLLCFQLASTEDPHGHQQPLRLILSLTHVSETDNYLNSLEFYNNYVRPVKPVILRQAAKSLPSFKNLKSDNYLRENFGGWNVLVKSSKKENRSLESTTMKLSQYLDIYSSSDVYMEQNINPTDDFADNVYVPKPITCYDFSDKLNNATLWLSSGGTKSDLHVDAYEYMHCLIYGENQFLLADRKYRSDLPIDLPNGHSSLDVERVDLIKYPTINKIPWYIAKLQAGDCLYLPNGWAHQVTSSEGRSLAWNLWWLWFGQLTGESKCDKSVDHIQLSELKDSGVESLTLLRYHILLAFQDGVSLDRKAFADSLIDDVGIKISDLFDKLDTNKNGVVTAKEAFSTPPSIFQSLSDEPMEEDSKNTKQEL